MMLSNMRWLILTLLTSLVLTCGQKGPLELPDATLAEAPVQVQLTHAE